MNITTEDRMDSIEQQLKELRKEMEDSIARYKSTYKPEKCCEGGPQWGHNVNCRTLA